MGKIQAPRPRTGSPPASSSSGIHLWLILWKAFQALQLHAYASIRSLGLGLSDFGILEVLLHKGPTPVNAIGAKINLTSGSISVAIDRLEARGLVERKNDPEDRRTRTVFLTAQGRRLIDCAFTEHAQAMERAATGLAPSERAQAIRLLKKLGARAAELLTRSAGLPADRRASPAGLERIRPRAPRRPVPAAPRRT
jgi:MarR family transcriptional regulator, 2-MHQ and catechol-resistance regulon repressor